MPAKQVSSNIRLPVLAAVSAADKLSYIVMKIHHILFANVGLRGNNHNP